MYSSYDVTGRRDSDEVDLSDERVVKIEARCGLYECASLDHRVPD